MRVVNEEEAHYEGVAELFAGTGAAGYSSLAAGYSHTGSLVQRPSPNQHFLINRVSQVRMVNEEGASYDGVAELFASSTNEFISTSIAVYALMDELRDNMEGLAGERCPSLYKT